MTMAFGIPMSPEDAAEMKKRLEMMRADREEAVQRQVDFIEGLSFEHLTTMQEIVRQINHDANYGQYMNGWISHLLFAAHKVCQFCGEQHQTIEDVLAAHAPKSTEEMETDQTLFDGGDLLAANDPDGDTDV